jgi:hypothetical protein
VQLPPTGLIGRSETPIDVPLDEILAEDRLILIHRSEADLNTYPACGNVMAEALPGEQRPAGGPSGSPLPGPEAGPVNTELRFPTTIWLALADARMCLTVSATA